MKTTKHLILITLILIVRQNAQGQGFVNLDFESATIAPTPVGGFTFPADPALAFPGWVVGGSGTVVSYNGFSLGAPAVNLMGPNFPNAAGYIPLEGSYSVLLQNSGFTGGPPTLSQTGLVPADAQSISFLVPAGQNGTYAAVSIVTLNGINIPLVPIAGGRVAGNVSAFAGSVEQLTFADPLGSLYFDDIQFSPSSVPEPCTLALASLGALLLGFRRWRNS